MNTSSNPQIDLAFKFVSDTNKHIFLTGKAGTGKTTFLRRVRREVNKRMAVVAPTGVAAINAEGVTIHSLFQLPFGTFIPGQIREKIKKQRFNSQKIKLLKSLDLLIIDEISMVRADLLDAIDEVLRRYRDFTKPFGGVQLLMIGDLHQLPPVIKPQDWNLMREHYKTAYFFGSLALQQSEMVTIELQHIYRQSDNLFIDLLNKVRGNRMDFETLQTLNSRFRLHFKPDDKDGYITLTSHNRTAQEINAEKLKLVPGSSSDFEAEIDGEFPSQAYPNEVQLTFKIGAQVMFLKNDLSADKLFYNGKIGRITRIDGEEIQVLCPGDKQEITVLPAAWQNRKFTLNEKTKEVEEEIIGTFTQYPLKLAWAITIHKSQGLTFERVIIDAQAAFAHGQVYVALSRCKSFEGIVLRSQIIPSSVKTDSVVRNYTEEAQQKEPGETELQAARRSYQQELLRDLFGFKKIKNYFDQLRRAILENENSLQGKIEEESANLKIKLRDQVLSFAERFIPQLESYLQQPDMPEANEALKERLRKAAAYFSKQFKEDLIPDAEGLQVLSDNKAIKKKVKEKLEQLKKGFHIKQAAFIACSEDFVAQEYAQAIVNAELDLEKSPAKKTIRRSPKDATHPLLYQLLVEWRDTTATEQELERYAILPTKSLLEIVEVLPTTLTSLKRVTGIGKVRAEKFGAAILELIIQYSQDHELDTDQLQFSTGKEPKAPKPPKPDSKLVSLEWYQRGKTVDEIAKERGLVASTIEGHLSHYVAEGELEVFPFVDRQKVATIEAYFAKADNSSFAEARQALGEEVSYGDLRMVTAYLKWKEKEG